jgi:hypothetical protein
VSEPHVIRLREPWDREPRTGGGARYRRFFNTPTGLTPGTTVAVVCEAPTAAATVWLNDRTLGDHAPEQGTWSHDVTRDLLSRNELTIDVATAAAELPWREVRLEIRSP